MTDAAALAVPTPVSMPEHSVPIQAHMVVSGGHGKHQIEMFALDPKLKFSRCVAGIFAALKHGDHHDFDGDRLARLCVEQRSEK